MRKTLFATLALLCLSAAARADVMEMPAAPESAPAAVPGTLPARGESMPTVLKLFGQPITKHPAVGGGSPKHPPITRWDYAGFSVFFERGTVIDAVVQGRPAEIHHTEELKPAK